MRLWGCEGNATNLLDRGQQDRGGIESEQCDRHDRLRRLRLCRRLVGVRLGFLAELTHRGFDINDHSWSADRFRSEVSECGRPLCGGLEVGKLPRRLQHCDPLELVNWPARNNAG